MVEFVLGIARGRDYRGIEWSSMNRRPYSLPPGKELARQLTRPLVHPRSMDYAGLRTNLPGMPGEAPFERSLVATQGLEPRTYGL